MFKVNITVMNTWKFVSVALMLLQIYLFFKELPLGLLARWICEQQILSRVFDVEVHSQFWFWTKIKVSSGPHSFQRFWERTLFKLLVAPASLACDLITAISASLVPLPHHLRSQILPPSPSCKDRYDYIRAIQIIQEKM